MESHKCVSELLFSNKRSRPDIQTVISFLVTWVRIPDEDNWKRFKHVLNYLNGTIYLPLTL